MEICQPRVLSSSVAPSLHRSITFKRKDSWGDGSRFRRWQFKVHGMTVSIRTCELYPPLTGCSEAIYDARHVSSFHWILSRIEASLWLSCTSSINITLLLSFFSIFCWNILSECICRTCQRPPRSVVVSVINILPLFTNYFGKYSLFHKPLFLSYILFTFLEFIPPSPFLDLSES